MSNSLQRRVILYHAHHRPEYIGMAAISARGAKRYMPDVEIVLLTEMEVCKGFDRIIKVNPVPPALVNFPPLLELPEEFSSAIYFDCDSYICAPFYDVFELVEASQVDMALVPIRHRDRKHGSRSYPSVRIPQLYPEFRGTPIAYKNSTKVRGFFSGWSQLFCDHQQRYHAESPWQGKPFPRQFSMRAALYRSDLILAPLPPKYYMVSSLVVHGTVRAFHMPRGKSEGELEKMARAINANPSELRLVSEGKEHLL